MTFSKNTEANDDSTNVSNLKECDYIASCDVGTTTIRCFVFKTYPSLSICGSSTEKITLISPKPGFAEIEPDVLWEAFISVIKKSIQDSSIPPCQIRCLGISTLRSSFLLWDHTTGEPLCNFITWKDVRADNLVKSHNNSLKTRVVKLGGGLLHFFTRMERFHAASHFKFSNNQVSLRLKWILENNSKIKATLKTGNLVFGTIDTWLIYKLTGGKVYATEHSNASGTGMYDPFVHDWSLFINFLTGLPSKILPPIKSTLDDWGKTDPKFFGAALPITAVVSDQGAAMFGEFSFDPGELKMTLGTGAFVHLHTGGSPRSSLKGIYPVVGWKDNRGIVFMTEGNSNDNGNIIEWGCQMGFYSDPKETSNLAFSVPDTNGMCFIPAFNGLQAPINDSLATSGFIGVSPNSRREHFVRAMLESLAFRAYLVYETILSETRGDVVNISKRRPLLRVDGGVSQNDFIVQTLSTLAKKRIERAKNVEASAIGCCLLAGLGVGIWKDYSELISLKEVDKTFEPDFEERPKVMQQFKCWEKALDRFTNWNQ